MSAGKSLSIGLGVAVTLCTAALLAVVPHVTDDAATGLALIIAASLLIGVGVAAAVWGYVGRQISNLRRGATHFEAWAQGEKSGAGAFQGDRALAELMASAERTIAALRKKSDQAVSQRREIEIQCRISEAERRHAEAILNSLADAVVVTDAFNEVAVANEAAGRLLGFELGSALRRPVDRVIHDPTLIKLIKDTREGGSTGLRRHVEHKLGIGGHDSTFDVTLSCVSDNRAVDAVAASQGTETTGVVTILRDITREKEIAEMKSDFVSNVSHELRTPLSSIKAYLEMLVDGEAQDEKTRMEFYNIIQGEANRLSRLIDNILNISRIESGVVKVQREHVSLPQLIKDAIDVMLPQARAKQIELNEVPTPVFFQVFADRDMIYQAILNLISNAIKYTHPGGRVTVAIKVDEHARTVNVSVIDTGVGVPPADLPHLFEKFYRVADHKKMAKGTGLGLNLVKHIVETVHGGHVTVTSEVGKGSTFTFSLPMADAAQ